MGFDFPTCPRSDTIASLEAEPNYSGRKNTNWLSRWIIRSEYFDKFANAAVATNWIGTPKHAWKMSHMNHIAISAKVPKSNIFFFHDTKLKLTVLMRVRSWCCCWRRRRRLLRESQTRTKKDWWILRMARMLAFHIANFLWIVFCVNGKTFQQLHSVCVSFVVCTAKLPTDIKYTPNGYGRVDNTPIARVMQNSLVDVVKSRIVMRSDQSPNPRTHRSASTFSIHMHRDICREWRRVGDPKMMVNEKFTDL